MFEKIIFIALMLGALGNKPQNKLGLSNSAKEPNEKSNKTYKYCKYYKSEITEDLIEVTDDIKFGYLGEEETQDVYFSFELKSNFYCYYCYFVFTSIDGEKVGYKETFKEGNAGEKVGILTIERNKLPSNVVNFNFYLAAFNNYDDIFESYLRPASFFEMDFALHNRGAFSNANGSRYGKAYYYFRYIKSEAKFVQYYDEIYFDSYPELKKLEIYFRLKPEDFVFEIKNDININEAKLYIVNNNGSFNDCTEYDSLGRYFPMIVNSLGDNLYSLSYKNVNNGGKNNLYLDPLTMHMYKEKRNKLYEVTNIYLPMKYSERYSSIRVMSVFTNFGPNLINVGIPFTINFEINYVDDFYYSIGRVDEIGNDSSGEEIIP